MLNNKKSKSIKIKLQSNSNIGKNLNQNINKPIQQYRLTSQDPKHCKIDKKKQHIFMTLNQKNHIKSERSNIHLKNPECNNIKISQFIFNETENFSLRDQTQRNLEQNSRTQYLEADKKCQNNSSNSFAVNSFGPYAARIQTEPNFTEIYIPFSAPNTLYNSQYKLIEREKILSEIIKKSKQIDFYHSLNQQKSISNQQQMSLIHQKYQKVIESLIKLYQAQEQKNKMLKNSIKQYHDNKFYQQCRALLNQSPTLSQYESLLQSTHKKRYIEEQNNRHYQFSFGSNQKIVKNTVSIQKGKDRNNFYFYPPILSKYRSKTSQN